MSSIDWSRLRNDLRRRRAEKGWTQQETGNKVLSQPYVSRIINGGYTPKGLTKKVQSLCTNLGINASDYRLGKPPGNAAALLEAAGRFCRGDPVREKSLLAVLDLLAKLN